MTDPRPEPSAPAGPPVLPHAPFPTGPPTPVGPSTPVGSLASDWLPAAGGPAVGVLPYQGMARTSAHRWWRPLTSTLLLLGLSLVFLFGAAAVLAGVGAFPDEVPEDPGPGEALLIAVGGLVIVAVLLPAVLLAARWGQRRPAGTVSSVAGRLRWDWLGRCVLVAAGAIAVQFGALLVFGPLGTGEWVGARAYALASVVLLALVPVQSAAEEYLARGWFVQAVGSWVRSPWPGILVGGALWTALHAPSTGWGIADLMFFSLVAGWLTVRTGGLEAAIALHAVGNVAVFLIQAAAGGLADEGTAGDADWTLLAADALALPLYAVAVVALHRRFARPAGPGPGPWPETARAASGLDEVHPAPPERAGVRSRSRR